MVWQETEFFVNRSMEVIEVSVKDILSAGVILLSCVTVTCAQAAALPGSTADHTKFEALQGPFASGPEVTRACLSCHTEAASQIQHTIHWTWEVQGGVPRGLGKRSVLNNYCLAVPSNWCRCTSCHVGFGWGGGDFDPARPENVDCLVCHDGTGTYRKFPVDCGHPAYETKQFNGQAFVPADLGQIARNVTRTSRQTCGICHFYGGGGDGVKHGDLDSSLFTPDRSLDVHMDASGLDYTCSTCHADGAHGLAGRKYRDHAPNGRVRSLPRDNGARIDCENCHSAHPHEGNRTLNAHTDRVACQTCHIPFIARGGVPTQVSWDWSTAGTRGEGGRPVVRRDERGTILYHSKKGDMRWGENLAPEYAWFDGTMTYLRQQDRVDPNGVVLLNYPEGAAAAENARIFPFKVHRGRQLFDPQLGTLVVPKLFGEKGSGAFWADFDWERAATAGMRAYGAPFSGQVAFVETAMYSPVSHMVAPKEDALSCGACHARNGRLAGIEGVYVPGRDRFALLDRLGWAGVVVCLAGVFLHGLLRIVLHKNSERGR